ncbi:MAG: UDP-N-acetylglucosamine--N-acetylmuramyl-(pentapeptide) pyrophosphoryl-undecaprenol N-acetylglucosamine transferase [Dehalococcoidia bacterium]|nr:UDP-N-acetylglucosamine--N-acetylmuramyl-(pentapeptide) pyrophosphoryl-undecaprenol N-acetylglucosamine transferase [Dehalococcoidia bacterium]
MKFALAGGGTGGHAYPAIAVAERLRSRIDTQFVYYGSERGPERSLAAAAGIPFHAIPASQLRGRSPWRVLSGVVDLWRGERRARHWLREDAPAAVFATGGYAAAPLGRAARRGRVPLLLFLPDVRPGWAVRFMQRYATTIACSVEASLEYLPPHRTVVTGYPVRRQFAEATRDGGVTRFDLDPNLPTVLVAGGSLGAHQINLTIAQSLRELLQRAQLLHICGRDEEPWLARERERLPEWQRGRYHLAGYTEDMAWAMAAADVAVTRSGASVLGELPMTGLPAILVPGAFSDQHANAAYLSQLGAAITIPTGELDALAPTVLALLDDADRRATMADAMRALVRSDAAERLATMLREMAA